MFIYYELFRPENGQSHQAEPFNFPIENVDIQGDQSEDLKPILPDQNLAPCDSDEDLTHVYAEHAQDLYIQQILIDPILDPIFSDQRDKFWDQFLKPTYTDPLEQEGNVSY